MILAWLYTTLAILFGGIIFVFGYGTEKIGILTSEKMKLEQDAKIGYPVFDLTRDKNFDSYEFLKAVEEKPFILKGGIPVEYTLRVGINKSGSDENIIKIHFEEVKHNNYMTTACLNSLQNFIKSREEVINNILDKKLKASGMDADYCKTRKCLAEEVISKKDLEKYKDFECEGMVKIYPVSLPRTCEIDNKLLEENPQAASKCSSRDFILKRKTGGGYHRQLDLESYHLNKSNG